MIRARTHIQMLPIAGIAAALAIVDWRAAPERAPFWIVALAAVAAIWLAVLVIEWSRSSSDPRQERSLAVSGMTAELIIAVALSASWLKGMGSDGAISQRAFGVIIGLVLLVIGNFIPKAVKPLTHGRCSPAQVQAIQRFCGWTFALAGLAYIAAWLVLPLALAGTISMTACAGAVLLVAIRLGWASRAPSP